MRSLHQDWKRWLFCLLCRNQHRKSRKMKKGTDFNEIETRDLTEKEFKIAIIKIFTKIKKIMHKHSENFNKEKENIRKYQAEIKVKNTVTELKNPIEGFSSRLDQGKGRISKLKEKAVECIQSEEQKEKRMKSKKDKGLKGHHPVHQCTCYTGPRRRKEKSTQSLFREIMTSLI